MLILDLAKPQALPLRLTPTGDCFVLDDDVAVNISDNEAVPFNIIVPKGYTTDFASIPPELGLFGFEKLGAHSFAALVHDYLYNAQVGYELANTAFYALLRRSNVPRWKAAVMAFATEAGGKRRYKQAKGA